MKVPPVRAWQAGALATVAALLLFACGGDSDEPAPESASISIGNGSLAAASGPSASGYGDWAREVCGVLERSFVQLQSVSVSQGDLGAFFETVAGNATEVADELSRLEQAPGTEAFMDKVVGAFRAIVPLLEEAGEAIRSAGPDATLDSLRAIVVSREPAINDHLRSIRGAAASTLPLEAQGALEETSPCNLIHGP